MRNLLAITGSSLLLALARIVADRSFAVCITWLAGGISRARLGVQVQQVLVNLARNLEVVHTQLADALGKRSHVTLAALIADLAGLDRRTVARSLEQVLAHTDYDCHVLVRRKQD